MINNILTNYTIQFDEKEINQKVLVIANNSHRYRTKEILKKIFSLIDLTSLKSEDNTKNISSLCEKVNSFKDSYPDMPNVAAICVFPSQVELIKNKLVVENIQIASVGAGFPSSQTFLEIKKKECRMAADQGANEIDIVISIGKFLEGDYDYVYNEIKDIKNALGDTHLKVILETGALGSYENIWKASIIAMEAGADFIKTSTGKQEPAASPEAVYIMSKAIKVFYESTGKKVGLKPAGGIAYPEDAMAYFAIVKETLGDEWLNNEFFRIGASRLANNLLSEILEKDVAYF